MQPQGRGGWRHERYSQNIERYIVPRHLRKLLARNNSNFGPVVQRLLTKNVNINLVHKIKFRK